MRSIMILFFLTSIRLFAMEVDQPNSVPSLKELILQKISKDAIKYAHTYSRQNTCLPPGLRDELAEHLNKKYGFRQWLFKFDLTPFDTAYNIKNMCISSDGKLCATKDVLGHICMHNIEKNQILWEKNRLTSGAIPICADAISFSYDSRNLLFFLHSGFFAIEAQSGNEIFRESIYLRKENDLVAYSTHQHRCVCIQTGLGGSYIYLLDSSTGHTVETRPINNRKPIYINFLNNDAHIIVVFEDELRIYETKKLSADPVYTTRPSKGNFCLPITSSDNAALITDKNNNVILYRFDMTNMTYFHQLTSPKDVAFIGNHGVAIALDKEVRTFCNVMDEILSGQSSIPGNYLTFTKQIKSITVSPDGEFIIIKFRNGLDIWHVSFQGRHLSITTEDPIRDTIWQPARDLLYSHGNRFNTLSLGKFYSLLEHANNLTPQEMLLYSYLANKQNRDGYIDLRFHKPLIQQFARLPITLLLIIMERTPLLLPAAKYLQKHGCGVLLPACSEVETSDGKNCIPRAFGEKLIQSSTTLRNMFQDLGGKPDYIPLVSENFKETCAYDVRILLTLIPDIALCPNKSTESLRNKLRKLDLGKLGMLDRQADYLDIPCLNDCLPSIIFESAKSLKRSREQMKRG